MHAGVSAIDFTPPPGLPLQGHWSSGVSHDVLYPLEARALVVRRDDEPICLITLDVVGIPREAAHEIRRQIQREAGIAPERVMIACSHTHCAPATLPCLGLAPDPQFMQRVKSAAVRTALAAADQLEPVTLRTGCGEAHFNINRRPLPGSTDMAPNPGALVDHRVRTLMLDRSGGEPLAVLFHYSCHPTTRSGKEGHISPDYPGVARAIVERQRRCRALFVPGCCGNIRPNILDAAGKFTSATPEQLERCGRELADAVLAAADAAQANGSAEVDSAEAELLLRYGEHPSRDELQRMTHLVEPMERALIVPWARRMLEQIDSATVPAGEASIMQSLRIGPVRLIGIPGEPVQEIGHAIEAAAAPISPGVETWPMGYTNDMVGYLCTPQQHVEGGYEPTAYPYFGRPAPFAAEQQAIGDVAAQLCRQLENRARVRGE